MTHLFINSYTDPDPARDAELQSCRSINVAAGLWVHRLDGRPTIGAMLAAANERARGPDVVILANADIAFPSDALLLVPSIGLNEAWALTRWEPAASKTQSSLGVGAAVFSLDGRPRCDSQDAWVFRAPVRPSLIEACNEGGFTLGVRGCDNRLAYEMHRCGYDVRNPSLDVRTIHLHQSGIRRYGHAPQDCVPKPYLLIDPHRLGERPTLRFAM